MVDEDFVNYKRPSMYIAMPYCTFKCEKESGVACCQNSSLAQKEDFDVDVAHLVRRYLGNNVTSAVVFGGLEPLDSFTDVLCFIKTLRDSFCDDYIVIYTGYRKDEIADKIEKLMAYKNIIVKYGRFIPHQNKKFDDVLGVYLASPNQYAEVIC
ncbi:MAG: 4Fe-4S cluster-binding domain-containing protein [Lachnospiraceae bacterium]|nr:4Fe-4S cluster-binding domain-containing protein [Lachnospiraceae bacterium]